MRYHEHRQLQPRRMGHLPARSEGGVAIAHALKTNQTLTSLNLQGGALSGRAFVEALKQNKTIEKLHIWANRELRSDEDLLDLVNELRANRRVVLF